MKTILCLGCTLTLLNFGFSCKEPIKPVSTEIIRDMDLKRGNVVICGPAESQLGTVNFKTSCSAQAAPEFNLGMALLHSFEYDEAEKVFAGIIEKEPGCPMAYWGVAMCNYHQVWPSPPSPAELQKGAKAISIAKDLSGKTPIENEYINAMYVFYNGWDSINHVTRSANYRAAMEQLYQHNPGDIEAAIFYSLALIGTADLTDKSYQNQKKAGEILQALYKRYPDHPGIVHYIIHAYDSPELAMLALPAAKRYAALAPSSAHAQHMPSHIFTRLGLWDQCILSNLASVSSAKCYAESAGIKGHWDEEMHGLDYLVYAYLQRGDNYRAKEQLDYLNGINQVTPENFKVAYAFAAIPARYYLENKMWKEAAQWQLRPTSFPWQKFPWQKSLYHFSKLLGNAHTGNVSAGERELAALKAAYDTLIKQNDGYKANQVLVQIEAGKAYLLLARQDKPGALQQMKVAAELEAKTEKSPVTPGEVVPASELLGDMLLQLDKPQDALRAYEDDLARHPNRFNGLYGAATASLKVQNAGNANRYFKQLVAVADTGSPRKEVTEARLFIKNSPVDKEYVARQTIGL